MFLMRLLDRVRLCLIKTLPNDSGGQYVYVERLFIAASSGWLGIGGFSAGSFFALFGLMMLISYHCLRPSSRSCTHYLRTI